MTQTSTRLLMALFCYGLWIAVTMLGGTLVRPDARSLHDIVTQGIGWHFVAAILLIAIFSLWQRWWRDLGLTLPEARDWRYLVPALVLPLLFLAMATLFGMPPEFSVAMIGFNTLLVAISEEMMFRGVLLHALRRSFRVIPSVLIVSLLFGAVHVLNVFLTGNLAMAILQSLSSFLLGLLFAGLVIRTGSVLPAIVCHWLWDLGLFLLYLPRDPPISAEILFPETLVSLFPLLVVTFNLAYTIYLLGWRKRETKLA